MTSRAILPLSVLVAALAAHGLTPAPSEPPRAGGPVPAVFPSAAPRLHCKPLYRPDLWEQDSATMRATLDGCASRDLLAWKGSRPKTSPNERLMQKFAALDLALPEVPDA